MLVLCCIRSHVIMNRLFYIIFGVLFALVIFGVSFSSIRCQKMQENTKKVDLEKFEEDGEVTWFHRTEEGDILGVSASQEIGDEYWYVFVSFAEFVREEPLESKFRKLIAKSLSEVNGVSSVEEEDREVWLVEGDPDGKELVTVCVEALKSIYPELKTFMKEL